VDFQRGPVARFRPNRIAVLKPSPSKREGLKAHSRPLDGAVRVGVVRAKPTNRIGGVQRLDRKPH
jgi:hypothetical protein